MKSQNNDSKKRKEKDRQNTQPATHATTAQTTGRMLAQSFQKPGHNQTLSGTPTTQGQEQQPDWQSKLSSTKHALEFSNHHHT
ncbi:hypothetical protein, partial [Bifidobacterium sp. UTCIF-39]|uniref:hypothetical protein n=1 Tax=Bifidobacterium sp. UTCIF-39 TaxID=1465359 RepID=UPI001C614692